ncbi:MAG: radical SAM family heme chaperone HemW [Bacilli bacterium]|nr:radical SAM family heme chaperone HemW [Bacilli bacterium]
MASKPNSLYIHIPFCEHVCSYCDFTKLFYNQKYEKPYLDSLENEIKLKVSNIVSTLYFGGGTPTALSDEGFERILNFAKQYLTSNYEFTVESNVENLTEAKLDIMKKCGVNRLSIGVQSTCNALLKEIGRNHTFEEAQKIVFLAKSKGFNNINIDLIYGFKNESLNDLKHDLLEFIKLDIDHISIYSLIIEKGSILYNQKYEEQEEGESRKFYEFIVSFLREHGYERYEISNFARNQKYSKHNLTYWHNEEYYGCGLGASGYVGGVHYENTKSLPKYLEGNFIYSFEKVDEKELEEYFLLTNLRLEKGFLKADYKKLFGVDFEQKYNSKILNFSLDGYFDFTNDRVRLTDEGLILMDFVLLKLL